VGKAAIREDRRHFFAVASNSLLAIETLNPRTAVGDND